MSDFDKYIRQGEPLQAEKARIWTTAIGLQDVDGLKPSGYLKETARRHIEGDISIEDVRSLVDSYYESKTTRGKDEERTEEADKVSAAIAAVLSEKTFTFSPDYLISIHRRLFTGVYKFAGQIRDYNISKKEWVLDGASVLYGDAYMIRQALDYDFAQERAFSYEGVSSADAVKHIAGFISGIWQIHPFGEGNTRTTAVFAIKYLRNFGFDIDNNLFEKHSWFFRNALVRANYNNLAKGILATDKYLVRFLRNLIFAEDNPLSNREMHISFQSISKDLPKSQFDTLNCTLEELAILKAIGENPWITQEALKKTIGKSIATVKRLTVGLQEKGILVRKNGKRNGYWEVRSTPDLA
ncbi:MAG: Fic family protein [Candidatus Cryptobacteroides sp.]